jgi:hypothetical protein
MPSTRAKLAEANAVGVGKPPPPQPSIVNKHSSGASGSIESVDANFTFAVVGAGPPGATTSRTPMPTIAAPVTPLATQLANVSGARSRCFDMFYNPPE